MRVRRARFAELAPATLYQILRLRIDIFVVEQESPYGDLDGRDLEPDAWHLWAEADDEVLSALRVLVEPDGRRIGRVVTRQEQRGRGLSGRLVREALALCDGAAVHVNAQEYLEGWYARFGFVRTGETFIEDGIPHVPMLRAAAA